MKMNSFFKCMLAMCLTFVCGVVGAENVTIFIDSTVVADNRDADTKDLTMDGVVFTCKAYLSPCKDADKNVLSESTIIFQKKNWKGVVGEFFSKTELKLVSLTLDPFVHEGTSYGEFLVYEGESIYPGNPNGGAEDGADLLANMTQVIGVDNVYNFTDGKGYFAIVVSDPSQPNYLNSMSLVVKELPSPTALNEAEAAVCVVRSVENGVVIDVENDIMGTIHAVDGKLIRTLNLAKGSNRVELVRGLYFVNVGGQTKKCIVK